jgi:hypothetical protein
MAASLLVKSDPVKLKRLNELRSALLEGIRKCGEVAISVTYEPLRKTIRHLELQSSQYANEINSKIEALGGKSKDMNVEQNADLNFAEESEERKSTKNNLEKQALKICKKTESSVLNLYSKILKEQFENDSLKKMIRYKMDGIMCITLQLKLLSKFLHNQ